MITLQQKFARIISRKVAEMSIKAYQGFSTRKTSQAEPIPGRKMVANDAGGFVFSVDDWKRLDRFLILGSDAPTYYVKAQELTRQNADVVLRCVAADGPRVVRRIVEISQAGRAPKNDPALFALALAMKLGDLSTRQEAARAVPLVARVGTHLFHFVAFLEQFGGWGRLTRRTIADWYNNMNPNRLAYQVIKYKQRDGWSHRDLLRLAHPRPASEQHNAIFHHLAKGTVENAEVTNGIILASVAAGNTTSVREIVSLIDEYGLTREMIPTRFLNNALVWEVLLEEMPLTAMIRNLGKMTAVGLLKPLSGAAGMVAARLRDSAYLKRSRIHPLSVLVALKIYEQGQGMRGSLQWEPVAQIADALDDAFYLSFDNAEPTGKRFMLALDISASMTWHNIAGLPITPREASAALALLTARTEPQHIFVAFSQGLVPITISPRQRLDDVMRQLNGFPHGGTDCALPMLKALKEEWEIDVFVVLTDSETWAGRVHPCQALQEYRRVSGIPAKLITVGMTSSGFTIADPKDSGMLDVVGFDTATPRLIADFARDE
jgi:60 kDa SS-A/Ro ribonucleoprotein